MRRNDARAEQDLLLRTSEVAAQLQVSARTVLSWAQSGKLPSIRTPSGHRRYPARGVAAALETMTRSGDQLAVSQDNGSAGPWELPDSG